MIRVCTFLLLFFLVASNTAGMPTGRDLASPSSSPSSPDQCKEGVVRLTYSVATDFSTSSTGVCDYNYISGTCDPISGVKFSDNGKAWDVVLSYTKDTLTLTADGFGPIMVIKQSAVDIFPIKDSISVSSDGRVFTGSIGCQCGYEKVMDNSVGFYCRLPKASLKKMANPSPKVERTVTKYFPLDCRAECENDNKCVLSSYDYVKKECYFHYKDSFSADYKTQDAKGDVVVFPGRSLPIMEGFSTKMSEGIRKQHAPTFMGYAKDEAHQTNTFLLLADMAYKGSSRTARANSVDPFSTVASIKSSILSLTNANGTTQLPVLDGPSTISSLMTGKEALSALDRAIISAQSSQDVAQLAAELSGIMKNKVNTVLQQGNFDFQFLVAEHKRLETTISSIFTSIQSYSDSIRNISDEAQGDAMIQFIFETTFVVSKAAASSAGLANPFATGASAIDDVIQNWRNVQLQAQKLSKMVAAGLDMDEASKTLADAYDAAKPRLEALKSTANMATAFIASFKDGKFTKQLTDADINAFLEGYANYQYPFSGTEVTEANIKLSKGFAVMCEQIIDKGFTVVDAGIFQRKCTQVTADLANIISLQTALGPAGMSLVEKTAAIISEYQLVSQNSALADSIQKTIDAELDKATQMAVLVVSAQVKSVTLRMQYTQHLIQLCTLAEYYSGGASKSMCKEIRSSTDVLSVDQIFTKLQDLTADTSIPSSNMKLCGYLPSFADENGSMENSLSLDNIARQSVSPFSFSNSDKWLRANGWDQIADGLSHGTNFFVTQAQLPMPYADVATGTSGLYASLLAMNDYKVVNGKTKLKSFNAGGSDSKYAFQYADASRVVCNGETVRNFMEPCPNSGAQKVVSGMCIQQQGDIQNYLPYSTTPVLPSLFSTFKVQVTKDAVSFKPFANGKKTVQDDKGNISILHENKMQVPICLLLKVAGQSGYHGSLKADAPFTASSYDSCTICPKGKFHQDPLKNRYECKDCPEGTYQKDDGRFTCVLCPIGEYQDEAGQSQCKKCPDDKCCPVEGLLNPIPKTSSSC